MWTNDNNNVISLYNTAFAHVLLARIIITLYNILNVYYVTGNVEEGSAILR